MKHNVILAIPLTIISYWVIFAPPLLYYTASREISDSDYTEVLRITANGYPNIHDDLADGKISRYEFDRIKAWSVKYDQALEEQSKANKRAQLLKAEKDDNHKM